ncbi:hypothetical protein NDU88_006102 [Pleurodeles waltl]|uniref:Uncharacterized protein n=1 Tax=Pleurodeles waltl TaxID=8319 RepID=A0AAV7W9M9_PLEWA|nr:hypothetical protein NDU88_006102 [Pleurodeles waltl]
MGTRAGRVGSLAYTGTTEDEMCETEMETLPVDGELALGQDEWEEVVGNDVVYRELKKCISNSEQDPEVWCESLKQYMEMKDELSVQGEVRRMQAVAQEQEDDDGKEEIDEEDEGVEDEEDNSATAPELE